VPDSLSRKDVFDRAGPLSEKSGTWQRVRLSVLFETKFQQGNKRCRLKDLEEASLSLCLVENLAGKIMRADLQESRRKSRTAPTHSLFSHHHSP
jgi:hypothetical protein